MSSFKLSWKTFLVTNQDLAISNNHLEKIRDLADPGTNFETTFETVSKNPGITFISLDPTESSIQLLHHCHIIGGSWASPSKSLISVLGVDESARPIQLIPKSVKTVKKQTISFDEIVEDNCSMKNSEDGKNKKTEFHWKNIIPIPHFLTKAYLSLEKTDPKSVAEAFFSAMKEFDQKPKSTLVDPNLIDEETSDNLDEADKPRDEEESDSIEKETGEEVNNPVSCVSTFTHVLQFCHLCFLKKMPPVMYSVVSTPEIDRWFESISMVALRPRLHRAKRHSIETPLDFSSDDSMSSPDQKISRKDQVFINTMLKLHDSMDKSTREKSDKEPGFSRLEEHRKNLILNASAHPPFSSAANSPTEFYMAFLAKKSHFKAKDMILHKLQAEKVSFNPSSSFINNLWNCDFFWLLPDTPSGISIFYCPETKSSNANEIEKERLLALADKVNVTDMEKLSKQKLYIPNTLMDLVWMTQNFYTVIKLCFGDRSHSAQFLKEWADHMYANRIMYGTLQASDPYFFAKVLFAIDGAVQSHWRSCSLTSDRLSVNDRVLQMTDIQDSILRMSFSQTIPKPLIDKISNYLESNREKDKDGKNGKNGKFNGINSQANAYKNQGGDGKGKQDVVYNQDKSHPHWRLRDGENFTKVFYNRGKECPKTKDGKIMCMKYLIRGLCDASCNRVHTLSKEDAKEFDVFIQSCREGASKPDF